MTPAPNSRLPTRGAVLNGSGTFDPIAAHKTFGDSLFEDFPFDCFVSKTITLEPRAGNAPPRLWETPAGLINSIGLPNKGLAGFLEHDLPFLARLPVPLMVSVMGSSPERLADLVRAIEERDEVQSIELNVSCPNVHTGLVMGADPLECARAVAHLRPLTAKPLVVKLTPNATDPPAVARAAAAAGADAVSLVNTLKGMAIHPGTGAPWLGGRTGGVSGAAIRAIALQQVAAVAAAVEIPIVGMGGISSAADALEFLTAGAHCVAVGTESFRDPRAADKVRNGIRGVLYPEGTSPAPVRASPVRSS